MDAKKRKQFFHKNRFQNHESSRRQEDSRSNQNVWQSNSRKLPWVPERDNCNRLGFKRLEGLVKKIPNDILAIFGREKDQNIFEEYLNSEVTPDIMVLLVSLLRKICEADMAECKVRALTMVISTKFLENLVHYLLKLFLQTAAERKTNKLFWENTEQFWNELFIICKSLTDMLLHKTFDSVSQIVKTLRELCFPMLEKCLTISDSVQTNFNSLNDKLITYEQAQEKKKIGESSEDYEEPPNDFRALSLYPTPQEVTNRNHAFLRKNIVDGGYRNVEHYLDVQFRLLREDFVAPLRAGICEFMHSDPHKKGKRINSVRIHRRVQFLRFVESKGKVGALVQFDFGQNKRRIKYNQNRRFMFGALVCFTADNFETLLFGTILDRDVNLLNQGQVLIDLIKNDSVEYNQDYIMIECEVYFEPYYHVMKALQLIDESTFPMSKYIVDVVPETKHPDYLQLDTEYQIDSHAVNPLRSDWPTCEQLSLDQSQLEAFRAGLTHEFAVIQGPPGTGKTYVGLKIVRTLLENHVAWNNNNQPILIVCYTNHALDQFLEGLISTTKKIIRIGGQSKSEKLQPFQLKEQRKKMCNPSYSTEKIYFNPFNDTRQLVRNVQVFSRDKRFQLKRLMENIQKLTVELEMVHAFEGVICFRNFKNLKGYQNSWFSKATNNEIFDWLVGGRTAEERNLEMSKQQFNRGEVEEDAGNVHAEIDKQEADSMILNTHADDDIDEDEYGIMDAITMPIGKYAISVRVLQGIISTDIDHLKNLEFQAQKTNSAYDMKMLKLQRDILQDQENLNYIKFRLNECREKQAQAETAPEGLLNQLDLRRPQWLRPYKRWLLYRNWLHAYENRLLRDREKLHVEYRKLYREYEETQQIEDQYILSKMLVIGMTTTAAAKKQTLLRALKCPIVVVEEAAEVLESHIVVSMTNACKHLILIGDHKQLKPSTADFNLVRKYNFNISLFERMVKNGVHCSVLGVQHRMRPEVASLIVPTIYPTLENHLDVMHYPPVLGMNKNVFFLTHTNPEQVTEDSSTKKNLFEATFLIELAKYLVLQGYQAAEITILTTYTGQMFTMWQEKNKYAILKDVRVTVVDNFQGEENKIILLSLVRSNEENKIGFLGTENRVCVALSRAREGFFIVGNMNTLTSGSKIWVKINETLENLNSVGTEMPLRCQVHGEVQTMVSKAEDFIKVAEGGCSSICGTNLVCGHTCPSLCHILDREHKQTKCLEKCIRILCDDNHVCPKKCYLNCGPCLVMMERHLKCGHSICLECHVDVNAYKCLVPGLTKLPCGHEEMKPCHEDPEQFQCPHECDTRLECGHQCVFNCHTRRDPDHIEYICYKECSNDSVGCTAQGEKHKCPKRCFEKCEPCDVVVRKVRTVCPHAFDVPCKVDVDAVACLKPCTKTMDCGHPCPNRCSASCGNCSFKVEKVASCGHKFKVFCKNEALKSNCNRKCPLMLPCGHPCTKKCKETCTEKCTVVVDSTTVAACGHTFKKPCYLQTNQFTVSRNELLQHCLEPCNETLKYGHKCSGTCGKCHQGRLHQSCQQKCGQTLICGHPCEVPCRSACMPCTKKCTFKCKHSKCNKSCGQPCSPCTEPCPRRCSHVRCNRRCGQLCSVPPCIERCRRRPHKKCKHPCIGFCGDPCPALCKICDREELTAIFLGSEDDPDAVFVALDCGHCFESGDLDRWFGIEQETQTGSSAITVKKCPRCTTPVVETLRYGDYVKSTYSDITVVKRKVFGENKANALKQNNLLRKVVGFNATRLGAFKQGSRYFAAIQEQLIESLKATVKGRRNVVNAIEAATLSQRIEIVQTIAKLFENITLREGDEKIAVEYADILLCFIAKQRYRITLQETEDLNAELMRLRRIVQLAQIEAFPGYDFIQKQEEKVKMKRDEIAQAVFCMQKYAIDGDELVKHFLNELNDLVKAGRYISDEEKKMIVAVMKGDSVTSGHWYKCPKGHVYCIGECGGANQMSKCPECGAVIGGRSHQLAAGNQVATEMDGARYAAWSEQANMANYRF